jgi:hypothetical protein
MFCRHFVSAVMAATLPIAAMSAEPSAPQTDQQRLRALEQRIDQIESAPAPSPATSTNSFNPAVSLILSGVYTNLSQDPATYRITGFPLPPDVESGPGGRGFSLAESELGVYANIDPYLYGGLNFALHPDDTSSVEEAFIQTIALSGGVTVKAGRFLSAIGYLNSQHAHTWDFADAPLAYQAFLGTQFGDDGLQITWLAPTELFLELGAGAGRGRAYPGSDRDKNGTGAGTLFAHLGGDAGTSHSWRIGLSGLATAPQNREFSDTDLAGNSVTNRFSGDTRLWMADFIWKYAPHGNAANNGFKLQAEYLKRRDDGELVYDTGGSANTASCDARQSGWYVQGIYQFMPYWRIGLRTEQLDHGTVDYSSNGANLAAPDFDPHKNSAMVDYSPGEFSRIRVQFARDNSRRDVTDNQLIVQYQMSLGAHGAHQF